MSGPSAELIPAPADKLRVAVEGCGHGTLHAIFASVEESCKAKGWDSVDLVIIGGDFQAVRNAHDLNVTAMPPKYRRMADFHEYYSGSRKAPYLTLFVGGNHEASNHLFELYYGGWVAPNIYYLGAANVLNLGSLRIAGLSGIWKGYDYRKPHFERLPYNQEDTTTIFHVRELDVRKLLSLRSQVDIGLSHDWPESVVWHGQYRSLFSKKSHFEDDAVTGKLGSVAARECLERLRPPYWFAAHLHCKYTATMNHEPEEQDQDNDDAIKADDITNGNKPARRTQDQEQVSAWQSFHAGAAKQDAEEREQILQERLVRSVENTAPKYTFQETFKKVTADDNLNRKVDSTEESEWSPTGAAHVIPQVDGCSFSAPRKRRREGTDSPPDHPAQSATLNQNQVDGTASASKPGQNGVLSNPDAIDIDMSDDDEPAPSRPTSKSGLNPQASAFSSSSTPSLGVAIPNGRFQQSDFKNLGQSEDSQDGGVALNPAASSFQPQPLLADRRSYSPTGPARDGSIKSSKSSLNPTAVKFEPSSESPKSPKSLTPSQIPIEPATAVKQEDIKKEQPTEDISEDIRAELANLSKSFAEPSKVDTSPPLPFPEDIKNKTTHFLALDKCEPYRDFLQLLEIGSITSDKPVQRPVKLEYDSVWLAILRTFASELELGGDPRGSVPPHRGEPIYHERIVEEEKWIKENVVEKGLLQVPDNFTITAPVYEPELVVDSREMPREYTNPQTSQFCKLIGIENQFDVSEEDRDKRVACGPREESDWFKGKPKGGRGGRQGGRGGRGGGRGARGGRGSGGGKGWGRR